jgi:hypothetical protein
MIIAGKAKAAAGCCHTGRTVATRCYFLRMPVLVLLKLLVALLAAGVSTALSCDVGG